MNYTRKNHKRKLLNFYIVGLMFTLSICFSSVFAEFPDKESCIFEHLSINEGLSQSTVHCIVQDRKGFLWIGTADGLNRYDGIKFKIFRHDPQDSTSLSANSVTALFEDSSGTLWVGTESGGLNRYNSFSEQFTCFRHDPDNPGSISYNYIKVIYEDKSGTLWFGTYGGGLNYLDRSTGQFVSFKRESGENSAISSDTIFAIYEDSMNNLWIGTHVGLDKFDRIKRTFTRFPAPKSGSVRAGSNRILSIFEGPTNQLYICTFHGIFLFDRGENNFLSCTAVPGIPRALEDKSFFSIMKDTSGFVWLGSSEGLYVCDGLTDRMHHFFRDEKNQKGLSNNTIRSLYEDSSGVIWIGTDEGMNKLDLKRKKFRLFSRRKKENSLSHNAVFSLYEDSFGLLWIGTNGGLNCYDKTTRTFRLFQNDPQDVQSISDSVVFSIYEDTERTLWFGTNRGLNKFNRDSETFTRYMKKLNDPASLSHGVVLTMREDRFHNFWVGTFNGGLNKFDRDSGTFTHYKTNPADPTSLSMDTVTVIFEDSSGELWVGTNLGLDKFDQSSGTFTHFQYDPANPRSISHNEITSLYEDSLGILWIGTGGGLNRLHREDGTFTRYHTGDGLPNDMIYGILEDDEGRLWLSTNYGLSRFTPATGRFRNYDVKDGLQSNEFNGGAYFKNGNGEMFFGGMKGFNAFFPSEVEDNPHIPEIVFTDFLLFNQSVSCHKSHCLDVAISEAEEILLTYSDSVFSFEFAALDFRAPEKNHYSYRMVGFDEKWLHSGTRNFVTYTNLDPGNYTFRVKGSNNDSIWNDHGAELKLTITPPPWKTWWAYSIYFFFIGAVILGYIRSQARKLERERAINEQLRRVDHLKDEFLANTSHELRTPLNGIIGLAESLVDGAAGELNNKATTDLSLIVSSSRRLANLVNDILDFSKMKTDFLEFDKKPLDVKMLVDVVLTINKPLITGKDIQLKHALSDDVPAVFADENRLIQILHNLVGNAIKFTLTGEVIVSAAEKGDLLYISVADTGIGIPQDKLASIFNRFEQVDASTTREFGGTGLGLAITKQLIELQGGSISVDSRLGQGATFTFSLPISHERPTELAKQMTLSKVRIEASEKGGDEKIDMISFKGEYSILIVDDEPINHNVLTNHLSRDNFRITRAFNGEECLSALRGDHTFDMVLLDIMMPRMSGYDVCRKIREQYLPSELPVIMITAKDQIADMVMGFSTGANDYLAKPFSRDELLARIKTHLKLLRINIATRRFVPFEFLHTLGRETILDVSINDCAQGDMTILFADIRSYTALAETMTPQDNFNFLNAYLRRVGPVIRNCGGFVNQYYGDGIMALFPGNAERAITASIEMQKHIAGYNDERRIAGRKEITVGIGIHSGKCILGMLGDEIRMDGGVVSDAVNTASRMESLTKRYKAAIIISGTALESVSDASQFKHRFLEKVRVKGKSDIISIYDVFEGENPEIKEAKLKTLDAFKKGQSLYFNRQFQDSITYFAKVLDTNPKDQAALLFIQRAEKFMKTNLSDSWQGIETLESK